MSTHMLFTKHLMDLLDYKIVVSKSLIGNYNSQSRNVTANRMSRRYILPETVPLHLPVIKETRGKCAHCSAEGIENKTYVYCDTCWETTLHSYWCEVPKLFH